MLAASSSNLYSYSNLYHCMLYWNFKIEGYFRKFIRNFKCWIVENNYIHSHFSHPALSFYNTKTLLAPDLCNFFLLFYQNCQKRRALLRILIWRSAKTKVVGSIVMTFTKIGRPMNWILFWYNPTTWNFFLHFYAKRSKNQILP